MKHIIFVEAFELHEQAGIYTIRYAAKEETETDQFFSIFNSGPYLDDIRIIGAVIDKVGAQGEMERWFRCETGRLMAIPLTTNKLRLYCYRVSDEVLLVGNGGLKTIRTFNENPVLNQHVQTLKTIGNLLMQRLASGQVMIYNRQLYGHLEFNIDDDEKESNTRSYPQRNS